jgi:hypothetical protein
METAEEITAEEKRLNPNGLKSNFKLPSSCTPENHHRPGGKKISNNRNSNVLPIRLACRTSQHVASAG